MWSMTLFGHGSKGRISAERSRIIGVMTDPVAVTTDLTMPEGLGHEEKIAWLRQTGEAVRQETGQASGVTEHQTGPEGQPVWLMWGSDNNNA